MVSQGTEFEFVGTNSAKGSTVSDKYAAIAKYLAGKLKYLTEESVPVRLRPLSASVLKPGKLMPYREITAVWSEIHTKHINALWAEHRISEC